MNFLNLALRAVNSNINIIDLREPESLAKMILKSEVWSIQVFNWPYSTIEKNILKIIQEINEMLNIRERIYLFGDEGKSEIIKNKYFKNNDRIISIGDIYNAKRLHPNLNIVRFGNIKEILPYLGIGLGVLIVVVVLIKIFKPDFIQPIQY